MGYFIVVAIVFLGFVRQRSHCVTLLMELYMWGLIAFNVGTTDFYAFEEMYHNAFEPRYARHEPGFLLLCKIMNRMGCSYLHFRMVIGFIVVILIVSGLKYFSKHINYALALYIIFPFPCMVAGLRFSVGSAIVIYGMRYLFTSEKRAAFKYILLVMLATLFHYSMLFFLIFIAAKFIHGNMLKFVALVPIVTIGLTWFLRSGWAYRFADIILNSEKAKTWLNPNDFRNHFSVFYGIYLMFLIGIVIALYISLPVIGNHKKLFGTTLVSEENVRRMMRIEILAMLGIVLSYLSEVVFMRVVFVSLPVVYTFLSEGYADYFNLPVQLQVQSRVVKCMMFIYVMAALFIFGYWINTDFLKVYQTNMIFGK